MVQFLLFTHAKTTDALCIVENWNFTEKDFSKDLTHQKSRTWKYILKLYDTDFKFTSIQTILVSLKMFENVFVCWDNFGGHHPEKFLKISEIFKKNNCSGVPL